MELLEERELPAFVGGISNPSFLATGDQYESANASGANGREIVVWTTQSSAGNTDIRGRVATDWGSVLITVANTASHESQPAVAMNDNGSFVVVWNEAGSIKGARYDQHASKLGSTITIREARNYVWNYGPWRCFDNVAYREPAVAMDSGGRFVVTTEESYVYGRPSPYGINVSTLLSIDATMFTATGSVERSFDIGDGSGASVARNAEGQFAVAYAQHGWEIELQRFAASGSLLGTHAITTIHSELSNAAKSPAVAMDDRGNTVVAYQQWTILDGEDSSDYPQGREDNWDIHARRVSSAGVMSAVDVVQANYVHEQNPAVAMDRSDGDYVVAYDLYIPFAGNRVFVTEMNASGTPKATFDAGTATASKPSVSINASDDYFLTYTAVDQIDPSLGLRDSGQGIFGRRGRLV